MLESDSFLPGMYICVRSKALAGRIIRWFTHSPVDHAFIYQGDGLIIESTPRKGVHQSPLSDYAGCYAVADLGDTMTGEQRASVVAAAMTCIGDSYGWREIALITLRRLGFRWSWLARPDKRELICSELVAMAGAAGGRDWLCGEALAAYVTPGELAARPGVVPVDI